MMVYCANGYIDAFAWRRKLKGVGHQVVQHLVQGGQVGQRDYGLVWDIGFKGDFFLLGGVLVLPRGGAGDFRQINRGRFEGKPVVRRCIGEKFLN